MYEWFWYYRWHGDRIPAKNKIYTGFFDYSFFEVILYNTDECWLNVRKLFFLRLSELYHCRITKLTHKKKDFLTILPKKNTNHWWHGEGNPCLAPSDLVFIQHSCFFYSVMKPILKKGRGIPSACHHWRVKSITGYFLGNATGIADMKLYTVHFYRSPKIPPRFILTPIKLDF